MRVQMLCTHMLRMHTYVRARVGTRGRIAVRMSSLHISHRPARQRRLNHFKSERKRIRLDVLPLRTWAHTGMYWHAQARTGTHWHAQERTGTQWHALAGNGTPTQRTPSRPTGTHSQKHHAREGGMAAYVNVHIRVHVHVHVHIRMRVHASATAYTYDGC
jgi:hypothetical protein